MTINIRFSPRVEPFCGEDSLTVFSNEVPEREKKKENIHLIVFWEAEADWTERGSNGHWRKKKVPKNTLITKYNQ